MQDVCKRKYLVSQPSFTHFAFPFLDLKGLFHPACLARVVSWFAFVVAIFMGHENGDKQRATKSRHVQGMLDETGPLNIPSIICITILDIALLSLMIQLDVGYLW